MAIVHNQAQRVKRQGGWMLAAILLAAMAMAWPASAQTTISTGSIQGTVTDPTGAVVAGVKITVTNKDTAQAVHLESGGTGTFASGALLPGTYQVRFESKGFKTVELALTVQVGVVTNGSAKLELGAESTVIQVSEETQQVNTEQSTVQGVMTSEQIQKLPFNGRNFLELAQLEPGVQIQDGGNFDPTKNGFSSISFGGRFGRTSRIEVDGIDISDETVGTTTQNVPASAIREFQLSQSSLDLSTELTSSGAVNVVTQNGTNEVHGGGYYSNRNDAMAAHLGPTRVDYMRDQYGASLGGPLIKNKLFLFGTGERTAQDLQAPVVPTGSFTPLTGSFTAPFRDMQFLGRMDWQAQPKLLLFFRFSYEQNSNVSGFIPNTFSPFANVNHSPVYAGGADFSTGTFTHNIRLGYTKFRNGITDVVNGSSIFNPAPGISIAIGGDPFCLTAGADSFCSGPNFLAPQRTFQSNKQFKYDGSKVLGRHILRYGAGYNRILGAVFAAFIGTAPIAFSGSCALANPLNCPMDFLSLGNGQGFFTEKKEFNFPAGGSRVRRTQAYIGDTWKVRRNFSVNAGVRYVYDSGRTDSDLAPIPCSATTLITCTGNLLDQFGAGLGGRVHQPKKNFAPQLGIAWDPWGNGKTVIRGGAGLYYENAILNNVLFDRPPRLTQGLFFGLAFPCLGGQLLLPGNPTPVTMVNGKNIATQVCTQPIGTVVNDIIALEAQYQAATLSAGAQTNGNFVGNLLATGANSNGSNLLAPSYRSPYSVQMNIGVERELRAGTVLKADYVRNVAVHYLMALDSNHLGDARFLNTPAALNAILATNTGLGCTAGGGTSAADINCAIGAGASIFNYAANGLDSGNAFQSGFGPSAAGLTTGTAAAFGGVNPNVGQNQMLFPIGRAVYNALQLSLRSNWDHPFKIPWVKHINSQWSYSFSRYVGQVRDTDFITNAPDFANPNRFIGPTGLDRTHQYSSGSIVDLPGGLRVSYIGHYYSALPVSLLLPTPSNNVGFPGGVGAIFTSDLTGDGTFAGNTSAGQGDFLTGTNIGAFGRDVGIKGLTALINNYNSTVAGTITPAGQALVTAGLFTAAQLGVGDASCLNPAILVHTSLCAVAPRIAVPVAGQVKTSGLLTFDLRISWVLRPSKVWHDLPERLTIEPQMGVFNLFNRANFDTPSQPRSPILAADCAGAPCTTGTSVNNTTKATRTNRAGLGTGVFALGSPRQFEFGVKVTF